MKYQDGTFRFHDGTILPDVDINSFRALNPGHCHKWDSVFGADKKHAYCMGKIIDGVDVNTFAGIGYEYAKDETHVYYRDCTLVAGANAVSFSKIGETIFYKDKSHVFYSGHIIPEAQSQSFRPLDDGELGVDDQHVFYRDVLVPNVDPKQIENLPHPLGKEIIPLWNDGKVTFTGTMVHPPKDRPE